jgi:hypothetical protein
LQQAFHSSLAKIDTAFVEASLMSKPSLPFDRVSFVLYVVRGVREIIDM